MIGCQKLLEITVKALKLLSRFDISGLFLGRGGGKGSSRWCEITNITGIERSGALCCTELWQQQEMNFCKHILKLKWQGWGYMGMATVGKSSMDPLVCIKNMNQFSYRGCLVQLWTILHWPKMGSEQEQRLAQCTDGVFLSPQSESFHFQGRDAFFFLFDFCTWETGI